LMAPMALTASMAMAENEPLEPMLARDAALELYQSGDSAAAAEAYEASFINNKGIDSVLVTLNKMTNNIRVV